MFTHCLLGNTFKYIEENEIIQKSSFMKRLKNYL